MVCSNALLSSWLAGSARPGSRCDVSSQLLQDHPQAAHATCRTAVALISNTCMFSNDHQPSLPASMTRRTAAAASCVVEQPGHEYQTNPHAQQQRTKRFAVPFISQLLVHLALYAWELNMCAALVCCVCLFAPGPQYRPSSANDSAHWTTNSGAPVWNNNNSLTGERGAEAGPCS